MTTPFGAAIRRARESRGLNQSELARVMHVDKSYISRIERGVWVPASRDVVQRLADALSVTVEELEKPLTDLTEPLIVAKRLIDTGHYDAARKAIMATMRRLNSM